MNSRRQQFREALIMGSFILFPATFYYFSPYLAIEGVIQGVISGSLIIFAGQFVFSLFLGRAFCGWVCPAGGAQDLCTVVNKKKIVKGRFLKWLIWIPWVATIIAIVIKRGGEMALNPFYQTTLGLSVGNVYALLTYFAVLALIIAPALLIGRRSFCQHLCWMAPFMILGRKVRNSIGTPGLQLSCKPQKCIECNTCSTNCPMSIDVKSNVLRCELEHSECILCMRCLDNCPQKVLSVEFSKVQGAKISRFSFRPMSGNGSC